jgi:hypothetical protein
VIFRGVGRGSYTLTGARVVVLSVGARHLGIATQAVVVVVVKRGEAGKKKRLIREHEVETQGSSIYWLTIALRSSSSMSERTERRALRAAAARTAARLLRENWSVAFVATASWPTRRVRLELPSPVRRPVQSAPRRTASGRACSHKHMESDRHGSSGQQRTPSLSADRAFRATSRW